MEYSKQLLIKECDKLIMKLLYQLVDEPNHIARTIYANQIKNLLSDIVELTE